MGNLKNILLVTNSLEDSNVGGRENLCKLNNDILSEIYGDHFFLFSLDKHSISVKEAILALVNGYIDGVNEKNINLLIKYIRSKHINKVFIDGSNLGKLAKIIKCNFPDVKIYIFFHNVESRFFLGSLKRSKTIKASLVLVANFIAERMAVRYSDFRICLSDRDSKLLKRIYGKKATHISPISLTDKLPVNRPYMTNQERYILFVGGDFYANIDGINWFIRNVASKIRLKTYIVGRGISNHIRLNTSKNVKVIGEVNSLSDWYVNCCGVVAPIFDGSGMKTKVAESLMFGKHVYGTEEAFSGYEDVINSVGYICNSADDFIFNINKNNCPDFDKKLRDLFLDKYSYEAAKRRISYILLNT